MILEHASASLRTACAAAASAAALVLVACGLAAAPASLAQAQAARDEAVLEAADAFRLRDAARLGRAAAAARGHLLEPYVDYWQLVLRLDDATREQIRAFLTRNRDAYVADRLRAEWIRQLGRRQDWAGVVAEAGGVLEDDAESGCWIMQARWRQGDALQVALARPFFDQVRGVPDGCIPLVEQLIQSGQITRAQVWERARNLLDAGQTAAAARTLAWLPPGEQIEFGQLQQVSANPRAFLDRGKYDLATRPGRELVLFALGRLARNDPAETAGWFERQWAPKLAASDAAYVYAQLALAGARRHMPEAIVWYARADALPLPEEYLAWRVRIALRHAKWLEVRNAIAKMPVAQKNDATWVYWLARAQRELGHADDATDLFNRIASQPNFYGKLAAEELGRAVSVPPVGHVPSAEDVDAIAKERGLRRALALYRLDLRMEALREWNFSIRGWDDKRLLAAAELARRNEVWDRAINTADRTAALHDYNLRFLAPYRPLFSEFAKQQNIEESWVLGLVRQESRFIPTVKSSAGAAGLMQLMPGTARMVARRIGVKDFRWNDVTDPELNIKLGTSYMREVLDGLDGHPLLASAAYNAGPGRAQRWRGDTPLEGAIYAETIPFNETRDYVKKVMSNTMYYAALAPAGGAESRTLKARLGTITPRPGASAAASAAASTAAVAEPVAPKAARR